VNEQRRAMQNVKTNIRKGAGPQARDGANPQGGLPSLNPFPLPFTLFRAPSLELHVFRGDERDYPPRVLKKSQKRNEHG
jgi:hypothetical protein